MTSDVKRVTIPNSASERAAGGRAVGGERQARLLVDGGTSGMRAGDGRAVGDGLVVRGGWTVNQAEGKSVRLLGSQLGGLAVILPGGRSIRWERGQSGRWAVSQVGGWSVRREAVNQAGGRSIR